MNALTPRAVAVWRSVRANSRNVPAYSAVEMNCFVPVIRQPSSTGSARVRNAPASDPDSGSVSANAPITSPRASGGTNRERCSSVPNMRIGSVTALVWTATVTPTPASARESSSSTRMYERKSASAPPYSSGMQTPISPSSASSGKSSRGKRCSRSQSPACGSIFSFATSRASAWISRCSSESPKSIGGHYSRGVVRSLAAAACILALLAGCGSGGAPPSGGVPARGKGLNEGGNHAAAELFAPDAEGVQGSVVTRLRTHADAVAWNTDLPCSGKIVSLSTHDTVVRATFVLGDRKSSSCDGPGKRAAAVFRIRGGKIVLWHQVPAGGPSTSTVPVV